MRKNVKGKKKINRIKLGIAAIVSIIVVAYSCWAVISLISNPLDTFTVTNGKLSLEENVIGYVIREENIVQGENYKNGLVKIKENGEKVSKGDAIFRYLSSNENELVQKIEELDVEIQEAMQKETNLFPADLVSIESQIKVKIELLYKENNIEKINKLKNEITSLINKKAKIAGELSPAGSYLKELISKRSKYENELNSNSEYITAPTSGIVSYRIDGYEEILNLNSLDMLDKNLLENIDVRTGQLTGISSEAAKVVNNFESYIAVILDSQAALQVEEGDTVKIELADSTEIKAEIYKIKNSNEENEILMIFRITNGVEYLIDYRKVSLKIIWWSSTGLKVPNDSIVEKGELSYVIRNKAGYLDEILVKVLKQNQTYSIIDNYSTAELKEMGYTSTEIRSMSKITMYDEIVLKHSD